MEDEAGRRKLVVMAISLTAGTPAAATAYEIALLNKFIKGLLTIEDVIELVYNEREAITTLSATGALPGAGPLWR